MALRGELPVQRLAVSEVRQSLKRVAKVDRFLPVNTCDALRPLNVNKLTDTSEYKKLKEINVLEE